MKSTLAKIFPLVCATTANTSFASENMGEFIFHHISNSPKWSFFPGQSLHLPASFMLGPINLGITLHVLVILLSALVMLFFLIKSSKRNNLQPTNLFSHAIEAVVQFLRDQIVFPNLGEKDGRNWLPFFLTLFFFILTLNLVGLVPGMATATSNINVTAALGIMVFFTFNFAGMKHNGIVHYMQNLVPKGIPAPVLLILAPIEIVGLLIRPASLAIRLFANMTAGHIIILCLLSLISILKSNPILDTLVVGGSIAFSLFIYTIELGVAFLQAYVFTLLTSLYIGSALHQEH